MLCAVLREGRSGVLQVRFGKSWKRLHIVLGSPVDYDTDREADPIVQALAASTPDGRAEHLRDAVAASLEWATGQWSFAPASPLAAETIDPALLPDPVTMSGLWAGVKQHLSMDEAMPAVTSASTFVRAADFEEWFPLLAVEAPFDDLPAALADGCGMDVLYRRIPDRSGNLVKLLWLLQRAALFDGQFDQRVQLASRLEGLTSDESQPEIELIDESASWPSVSVSDEPAPLESLDPGSVADDEVPEVEEVAAGVPEEASAERRPKPRSRYGAPPPPKKRTSYVYSSSAADGAVTPSVADEEAPTVADDAAPTETEPKPHEGRTRRNTRDPAMVLRRDYDQRMRKDYYTFLGLDPEATATAIERRARQLAGRWQAAMRSRSVPSEIKELAKELATGVQLVYRTLADPKRRAEYDRRMAAGQAPVLRPIKGATRLSTPGSPRPQRPATESTKPGADASGGAPTMNQRIEHFVEAGEWRLAAGLLKEARLINPSDPDVLAHLGWVTWKLEKDEESAEEFLRLAVTFNGSHAAAIGYLARLSVDTGDTEAAHKWLNRVLELDRGQRWARRALRKLPPLEQEQPQKGLKFWRKGD